MTLQGGKMAFSSTCVFLGRSLFHRNVVKIGDNFPKITAYLSSETRTEKTAIEEAVVSMIDDVIQPPKKKMSKAMKAYLQRAKETEEFMKNEKKEFEIGKRHLANMMGENPDTFTQADIDKAIEYLFPSGLYEPRARPLMKEPDEIFPPIKAAQFAADGRPFHSMFYTTKPSFFEALHNIVDNLQKLNKYEDEQILKGILPNEGNKANLLSSVWVSKEELESSLIEVIHDKDYENFIAAAEKLADHPYSGQVQELLDKYRKVRHVQTKGLVIPPLNYDASGRPFIYNEENRFLTAFAAVKVWGNGTGEITINGKDLTIFKLIQHREQGHRLHCRVGKCDTGSRNLYEHRCELASVGWGPVCHWIWTCAA